MTRNASRTRRPARTASRQPVAMSAVRAELDPADAAWERALHLTRAMIGASLGMSGELMQGVNSLQRTQAASTQQACERIGELAERVQRAPDWPSLLAAQAALAGTQWTQSVQDLSTLCQQCVQIESRVIERGRTDAANLSQRWPSDSEFGPMGPQAALTAPLAMANEAQAAMTEMTRWWSNAVHDSVLPD